MSKTKAEIRDKVARKLGIKKNAQALVDPIKTDLDDAHDEAYATLQTLELVSWSSTAEVPDDMVFPFVAMIALSRIEYAVGAVRIKSIVGAASTAKERIRELITEPYFSSAEDAVYF